MITPTRRELIREIVALHKQGVPRWTAASGILDKYRLRRLPLASEDGLRIRRSLAGLNIVMKLYRLPATKAGLRAGDVLAVSADIPARRGRAQGHSRPGFQRLLHGSFRNSARRSRVRICSRREVGKEADRVAA